MSGQAGLEPRLEQQVADRMRCPRALARGLWGYSGRLGSCLESHWPSVWKPPVDRPEQMGGSLCQQTVWRGWHGPGSHPWHFTLAWADSSMSPWRSGGKVGTWEQELSQATHSCPQAPAVASHASLRQTLG